MTTFAILLGGGVTPTARLKAQLAGARFIAADGGMAHATLLGATVELWVGDFDSTDAGLAAKHSDVARQTHLPAKDETDGALAVSEALSRGATNIIMVGGLGGVSDHALSHLTQLLALAQEGIVCHATSGLEEAWPLLPGSMNIDAPVGTRMSIVGFSPLTAISLAGVSWPLTRRDVPLGSSLTMSNVLTRRATIDLEAGYGAVLLTFES